MAQLSGQIGASLAPLVKKSIDKLRIRKGLVIAILAVAILQAYFVRELLAAELLFGLVFAVLLALGALAYFLGALGERGLDLAEAGIRLASGPARKGYLAVEEFSRKPFRRLRSESAQ
jgi:hypothetical protein